MYWIFRYFRDTKKFLDENKTAKLLGWAPEEYCVFVPKEVAKRV